LEPLRGAIKTLAAQLMTAERVSGELFREQISQQQAA
jgi:hypothetical protein